MTFSWIVNSDWMMHLSQVQAFAHLPFFDVITNHPLYSGEILSYPFFINWFSGNLLSLTGNLVFSMTFPLYLGSFLFLSGIYLLSYQLTKNKWIAFVTPFIFFFLAGFQGYFTVLEYSFDQWENLFDYQYDLDFLVENGFNWKSFFLTTYIPQRSFLWGMAIGTLFLGLFVKLFHSQLENKLNTKTLYYYSQFFFIGLGIGSLSVIHTHTFFWFFFLFLGLFFIFWRQFFIFLALGLGACFTGLPFVYLLLQKEGEMSQFSLFPLSHEGYENFFSADVFSFIDYSFSFGENFYFLSEIFSNLIHIYIYWFWNWGIVFIAGVLFLFPFIFKKIFPSQKSELLYPLFIISFVLLLIFSIVQLQGNPWDNTKVHLWSGLFFALIFSGLIIRIFQYNLGGKIFAFVLFFISSSSGIIMVYSGINDSHSLVFSKHDQEISEKISELIPHSSLVLTSDYFHHYFAPLTPNSIFMGYRGWIASYGMDYDSKISIAQDIYSGNENALDLLKKEKIDYILVDNSAAHEYKISINDQFFYRYFEKIEIDAGSSLYKVIQ